MWSNTLPGYNNIGCKPVSASVNHDDRHLGLVHQSELDYSGWIKTRSTQRTALLVARILETGGTQSMSRIEGSSRAARLEKGNPTTAGGTQTCITFDAINHAYVEARKRINVARPKSEMWRPEDLATVGELLLDITTNLAQTYGLTYEEIQKSLPLIDTSKTLIREVCPAFLSNIECRPGKYRRFDGLCTNLENPTWGATLSPFARLMSPQFADGLSAPRISITGHDLPLSRVVSRTMHPDEGYHDHAGTVMVIAWGQFMDHDYTLTATPLDPLNRNDPEECCGRLPHQKNPYCNEIFIPEDDYFYKLFNVQCMNFVRAFPAVRPGCRLGSRVPFNLLTGVLDGNTVYGITEAFARKLRTGYGGLLRMNPVFAEYGLKDLLPLKLDIPDEGCTRPNRSLYCFEAGEIRVNEQLVLTCMHTLMAREHNRIAKALAVINPHWDDEILFQEARRIVIAEIQHITYNEFLPILLGKDVMEKFGLLLEKEKYWDGYDSSINPGVIDAFAAAAFRFGHSLLPTAVERWSKAHKFIASKRLSDLIRRPYDLYRAGVFDEYLMGLMNQVAQAMDDSITQEVTNHLFKKVGAKFGLDLVSFNMQRGREFGIPSYMEFRKYCGLPDANTFDELFGSMPNETVRRYSTIFDQRTDAKNSVFGNNGFISAMLFFRHPADVDLWSGGVSERPLPGSMLGPTFACLIATQFSHSRRGDRFWYELPNQPSSFTLEQLNEIRKTKLARLICDNTDLIDTVQIYPMVLPDHEINPRVPCRSGIIPGIDLSKWAEFPTSHAAEQYDIIMKSTQAASEIKPTLQHAYINKFNRKLKSMGKNTAISSEKKLSKPWWIYPNSIGWKKHTQHLKMPQKLLQQQEKFLNKQIMSPTFHLMNNQNKNVDLSDPDMEIIKITTIVEAIRQKRQNSAQMLKAAKSIQKIIGNKRSKRSSYKSENNSQNVREKTIISNKKSRHSNPNYRKQFKSKRTLSTKKPLRNKNATDLKTANNVAIPSTVFYKRIWEYINGTRPHTDIISGYNSLENNSDNSTCIDKDRITASQSQEDKSQVTSANIKPERDFYKRIWDIINATQSIRNEKARSKRNANIPESNAASTPCIQEETVNYKEDKQVQATNNKIPLNITDINLSEISDSGPYISGFWNIANKIQWQPNQIPVEDLAKLNNNPILSSLATSASEVDDLNKFPDKVESVDYSSLDNSTEYTNEMRNSSQEIISEPGSPYSSEESFTTSSFLPTESTVEKPLQEKNQVKRVENSTGTIPNYDPSNIPYVEVPDYSDQQEKSLDKNNQSITPVRYNEYDNDYDYIMIPKQLHDADDFSSKSPSAKIKVVQTESDGLETSLNANHSRLSCTENKNSAECVDNYDVEDTKLRNNTEDVTDDIHHSAEEENENSDFIDFDEYKKPINWDEFLKDPILESIRAVFSKKYDHKENPDHPEEHNENSDRTEEFEEIKTYATDPKEQSQDYFVKNEDHDDHRIASDDTDEVNSKEENTDSYAKKEEKQSEEIDEDPHSDYDKDFFKNIFEKDNDKESSDTVDAEKEFLSRYFTKDVLHQLQDNSTAEEDRQKEESRNREDIQKTLSKILEKKDHFSRLDENLNKMIEKGEAIPIKYNNFWSLEYESPRKRNKDNEQETEDSKEEA
ncbi:Chorion peroxidase [Atta colombica]|uniref:Chorion peroxidase n=1 Tax=Atta colombica TaxID=520822 RepID=A0A195BD13_9HYME|nr:Chorion peroxidase [Atta colombica]